MSFYMLGSKEPPVKGRLDDIETRIDNLLADWTQSLLNTITDPFAQEQMKYLSSEQRGVINTFIQNKVFRIRYCTNWFNKRFIKCTII